MSIELFDNLVMLKVVIDGTEISRGKYHGTRYSVVPHTHGIAPPNKNRNSHAASGSERVGEGGVIGTVTCTFTFTSKVNFKCCYFLLLLK